METPETIFKTRMSRVWNQRDVAAIDELLAEDAPVHGLGKEPLTGTAGFKEFHAAFLGAFSEIHIEVERHSTDFLPMLIGLGIVQADAMERALG